MFISLSVFHRVKKFEVINDVTLTINNAYARVSGVLLLIFFFFDRMLESNIDKVLAGRTGVRFFFPLCGKTVDMKWYEKAYYI